MPTDLRRRAFRERPLPGTGRLGVIATYFQLGAVGALIPTALVLASVVAPRVVRLDAEKPWATLVTSGLLAFGFLRTGYLLDRRRRSGALLAGLCFLTSVAGYFTASETSLIQLAVSGVGLALVASVWKHLEGKSP